MVSTDEATVQPQTNDMQVFTAL